MTDDKLIEKIESSHQAIASTISAYGDQTKRLQIRFDEVTDKLDKVIEQTTRTNGRVNSLENWRWFLIGGMSIITLLVIPLIVFVFNSSLRTVQASIEKSEKNNNNNYDRLLILMQKDAKN